MISFLKCSALLGLSIVCLSIFSTLAVSQDEIPDELGKVNWHRDLEAAKAQSRETGKPVLVFFQEVPGCETCVNFGRQPMSHPLMVEAIEDLFVPVLVYNNKTEDQATLNSFKEPSWNNPVIRYLDSSGEDLIERADRIWDVRGTANRMVNALSAANRDVPSYLQMLAGRPRAEPAQATFAMHCYWEGEAHLGKLEGVLSTRSAWVGEKEVVEVVYDAKQIDYHNLLARAKSMKCASTVYAHTDEQLKTAKQMVGDAAVAAQQGFQVRDAKPSDQKYYLRNSTYRHLPLTELQAVKINAQLMNGQVSAEAIHKILSPRQIELLKKISARLAKRPESLNSFLFPDRGSGLAEYDQRLRSELTN